MTRLRDQARRVRRGGDGGSALAIALVFLMAFGAYVGIVLEFAATGQRTTLSIRDEVSATYAGGGALDGAINTVRTSLTTGIASAGATTCFTLPAGALDNATPVTVTCTPRSGSGADAGGSTASQPAQAVLALAGNSGEGITVAAGSTLPTQGNVLARQALTVPATATLTSTGSVQASTCTVAGTVSPACVTVAAGTVVDPGWGGPDTTVRPLLGVLPACGSLMDLSPGIYRSATELQRVLDCPGAVVWFRPGTYFFDFKDAGSHQLTVGPGAVVVGGTPNGWTPGTTAAAAVPWPTAAAPTTSACDATQPGVDLVFGGDSRLAVSGGRVQMCALVTSTTSQHIVLRDLGSPTSVASSAAPAATTSASANAPGAWAWDTPAQGAVVDGATAHVKIPNTAKPTSKLSLTGLGNSIVPADATGVTVTVRVTETVVGTGNTSLTLIPGNGSASITNPLATCPTALACPGTGFDPAKSDTTSYAGLTPAQVNGMAFELAVTNPNNSPVEAWVDGIAVTVGFSVPVAATSGTAVATPYAPGPPGSPTALLRATGGPATTVLALHGTVYAPRSAIDLALTGVPYTVIDRGVVARHLASSMTPAATYAGPLVSVPPLGQLPRRVLLEAVDGSGRTLARADVRFADSTGTLNGSIPTVNEWSVN